jgi:stage II sporulation protein D
VLTALFVLGLASPAFAEAVFTVRGHGFGHGIGMSQYGAKGMAEYGASYSSILKHFYQGTTLGSLATEPVVRVAIQKSNTPQGYWTVRGNNADIWVDYPGRANATADFASGGYLVLPKGQSFTVTPLGSTTTITIRDQNKEPKAVITGNWVHLWERDTTKPRYSGLVQIMQATGPFDRQNLLYNGSLKLERSTSFNTLLHARNYVYLEDYVKCVVPRESPASWPTEAIKAQAVAARSYAYAGLKPTSTFDVYCTTRSQVYNGWGQWTAADGSVRHGDDPDTAALEGDWQSDPEVVATKLQLVKYGTTTVVTYFHSSSGGHTEDIDKAWPSSTAKPYYQGVPDPYGKSPYDNWGPWTYTASQVRSRLLAAGIPSSHVPDTITDIRVTKRGDSGRVMEMVLYGGINETPKVLSGYEMMNCVRNAIAGSYDT